MVVGDYAIVALQGHKVGRIGQIIAMRVTDGEWDPLVPPSRHLPDGEMGRRIDVRWDLACGPDDRDLVVLGREGRVPSFNVDDRESVLPDNP